MNSLKLLFTLVFFSLFFSCAKDDFGPTPQSPDFDYLIFGHFYGECLGEECVETFKLTSEKLYEDTNDSYAAAEPFNFVPLGDDKFQLIKDLTDFFPNELLNASEEVFGCPDCSDQGGLFIKYSDGQIEKSWRIDRNKAQVPSYLHEFMDAVNDKIEIINN